eukprot:scaffold126100_cov15-Tisochrysis_lutea.AAC.1
MLADPASIPGSFSQVALISLLVGIVTLDPAFPFILSTGIAQRHVLGKGQGEHGDARSCCGATLLVRPVG